MPNTKIYVEQRTYKLKELAPIIAVDPQNRNLKRAVKTKLNGMGFIEGQHYSFPEHRNGIITILWVPTKAEDKIQYLVRLLGIDKQVDSWSFAVFVYRLLHDKDFNCMPWAEREAYLFDNDEIKVSERTLRKWTSKLIDMDAVIKDDDDYQWWKTESYEGYKIRTPLDVDDEEINNYREFCHDFFEREDVKKMDKKTRGYQFFTESWNKFGCKFYKCHAFLFGAWHTEILEELINIIDDYVEQKWDEIIESQKQ